MFKKGDKVVCVDDSFIRALTKGGEYRVVRVNGKFVYVDGIKGGFFPTRFKLVEPKEPIWNNKCPKDMTKEELKAFICDRIDRVEMEFFGAIAETWMASGTKPLNYTPGLKYRVKPAKSEQLQAAERTLEDALAAVKAAQEAVAKAKES